MRHIWHVCHGRWSLPSRGAWIEIPEAFTLGRSCGGSLPSRGAWIEISPRAFSALTLRSRSPRGERGLKSGKDGTDGAPGRRSPRGERGLKFKVRRGDVGHVLVAPLAGSVD